MALFLPWSSHATIRTATQWSHPGPKPAGALSKLNPTTLPRFERPERSTIAAERAHRTGQALLRAISPSLAILRPVIAPPLNIVVLGNGAAGIAASEQIERLRPSHGVRCLLACDQVVTIDPENHRLVLSSGELVTYDRLILADSAIERTAARDSLAASGRFILNKSCDERYVSELIGNATRLNHARSAIVVGANRAGLEIALWLRQRQLEVSILEGSDLVLKHTLDRHGSGLVRHHLESRGIRVLTATQMRGVCRGEPGYGEAIQLSDGRRLCADVIMATPRPDPCPALAKSAGIASRNGILVDDFMQTSEPDIYAVGDIAEHDGMTGCDASSALEQGQIAGRNVLGDRNRYRGRVAEHSLCLGGLDILSVGQIDAGGDGVYSITHEQSETLKYRKLVFAAGRLLGAILIGYPDEAAGISCLVKQRADLTPVMPALHRGRWDELAQLAVAA